MAITKIGTSVLETVGPGELETALDKMAATMRDWIVEAGRGPKPVWWSATGTVATDGTLDVGGSSVGTGRTGPGPSMAWSVKICLVTGLSVDGDALSVYRSEVGASRLIWPSLTTAAPLEIGSDRVILQGGENLLFHGASLATPAATVVTVNGAAWELPTTLIHRFL
jgi:hypothetical protein